MRRLARFVVWRYFAAVLPLCLCFPARRNQDPYNTTGPDMDPPIPGHPCLYNKKKVIKGTADGNFNNMTGAAPNEDQLVVRTPI